MGDRSGSGRLRVLFEPALRAYERMTGITLAEHPLAVQLQSCQSIDSIAALVQDQVSAFSECRGKDRIVKSIESTIAGLTIFYSTTSFGAIDLPFPPVKAICAGLVILLAAAKSMRTSYGALVDFLESTEHVLLHLDIYSQIRPTPVLDEIVTKIMAELLSTLALLTKELMQGRSIKKLFNENIEAVLARLDRLTQDEARMSAVEVLRVIHALVQNMNVVVRDGKTSASSLREALEILHKIESDKNRSKRDALRRDIQNWLSPPDPWKNHYIARESHHEGTSAWFVESEAFSEWKTSGPSSLLWIHGKPGSGKSVLCSTIIEEIEAMRNCGLASLAFHYYDFREGEKMDRRGLLSSVLFQLCHQSDSYHDILSTFYLQYANGSQQPSDDALFRCFKGILKYSGQVPIFVIVDALDECPNTCALSSAREKVLMLLEDLIDSNLPNLRLCITSRPEVDIKVVLQPLAFCSVSIHDESGQISDIENYIKSIVNSNRKMRRWTPDHRHLVIDALTNKADGMWRWVYCQLDYLGDCLPGRIRHALDELPETLDETYERTLREIKATNWEYAKRLFLCVAMAARPLRAEELAEILAFDFKSGPIPKFREDWRMQDPLEAVLSTCSTLLALVDVDDSPVIQFSHFSVKEFLMSTRLAEKQNTISCRYHISMTSAHTLVAQACLGILLHLDENVTRDGLEKFPLAEYAATHWVEHARFEGVSDDVEEAMKQLFSANRPHLAVWVWICDPCIPKMLFRLFRRVRRPPPPRGSPLHYAAFCGLPSVVNSLAVERPRDVHSHAFQDKSTPLHLALRRGNMEVVRLLIKYGADATARDNKGSSSLHLAVWEEYVDLVRLFVECGAEATVTDNEGSTPLHFAVRKKNMDLVRLLIEHHAVVTASDNNGSAALHLAVQQGNADITRFLIEHGADPAALDRRGRTPLHLAVHWESVDLMRILVEHGADVRVKDRDGRTPLHLAVKMESMNLARFLVEHGADVTVGDENGSAALHLSVQQGSVDITRFLIEHGADPAALDGRGQTPLHLAVHRESVDIMRILVDRGADVRVKDLDGVPPLQLAVKTKSMNLTRFLVEHGADLTAGDDNGSVALHLSAQQGSVDLAHLLVEHGANVAATNNNGSTALHFAVRKGSVDLVRFLIKHGADAAALDGRLTPLHLAVHRESIDIVRMLVEHGVDMTIQDIDGCTPLHLAIKKKSTDLARLLIEHGGDMMAIDNNGSTALHLAVQNGSVDLARLLIEHGADIAVLDGGGQTPLHSAVQGQSMDLVRILVTHGAAVTVRNTQGTTPLHFAIHRESMDQARFLIEHGADATAKAENGWTPLHWAVKRGSVDLARFLIEHGADVLAQNNNGSTPLELALQGESEDLTRLLLDHAIQ